MSIWWCRFLPTPTDIITEVQNQWSDLFKNKYYEFHCLNSNVRLELTNQENFAFHLNSSAANEVTGIILMIHIYLPVDIRKNKGGSQLGWHISYAKVWLLESWLPPCCSKWWWGTLIFIELETLDKVTLGAVLRIFGYMF